MAEPSTAQAEVQREAVKSAGVDAGSDRAKIAADRIRSVMQERGHRAALEDASNDRGVTGANRDKVASLFNDPAEQARVQNSVDRVNGLLVDGYDQLQPPDQAARRDDVTDALLGSHVMGDALRGMDPTQAEEFATSMLKDKHFQALANQRAQSIAERRFDPNQETYKQQIDARIALLQAATPGLDKKTARSQATNEIHTQFRNQVQRDMDNVVGYAAHAVVRENLQAADEVIFQNAKDLDNAHGDQVAQRLEQRWSNRNPDAYKKDGVVRKDWDAYAEQGLQGLRRVGAITQEEFDFINANPELKKRMEGQVGVSLIEKRMRAGVLKNEDFYTLLDSKWMGETQGDRVDKMQEILTSHNNAKAQMDEWVSNGVLDKNFWQKIKDAGPYAAGGMIAAILLALLAAPASAGPLIAGVGLKGIGLMGAAAGGGGKFYHSTRA